MPRKGASAAFLKKLRKKYKLGEYSSRPDGARVRRLKKNRKKAKVYRTKRRTSQSRGRLGFSTFM